MNEGKLIILTGFSGAGKDTLMNMLLERKPGYSRIVTHTSRPPREGEQQGRDYHFVSKSEFEEMIFAQEFFEHVKYGSHYKGTVKHVFNEIISGKKYVWRIDMYRAAVIEQTVKERFEKQQARKINQIVTKLLIKTKHPTLALERYKKRDKKMANIEEFRKRLKQDQEVFKKHKENFPHIITNPEGYPEKALEEILTIINRK